jgi:hypothetical protein
MPRQELDGAEQQGQEVIILAKDDVQQGEVEVWAFYQAKVNP